MIKRIIYYLLFFVSISFAQTDTTGISSEIELYTYVEKEQVPLNREVVYHVELRWNGELDRFKITELQDPDVTGLTLRGSGSKNKVFTDQNNQTVSLKRITYYFTPRERGMAYVNGLILKYEDTVHKKTESLIAGRIGIKIIDPLPEPGKGLGDTSFYLLILFVILIVGISVSLYIYKKRKEELKLKELETVKETTEQKYLRLLKENIQMNPGNLAESISDLSRLLTGYFTEKFSIPAGKISHEELIQVFSDKNLDEDVVRRISDFYKETDLVKFAGDQVTESKYHQYYDTVELIIAKLENSQSEKEVE